MFSTRSGLGAPLPESPEYHSRARYACGRGQETAGEVSHDFALAPQRNFPALRN